MAPATPSLQWGHININVSNLDDSIAFYELLGFRVFIPGIPYLGLRKDNMSPLSETSIQALGLTGNANARACIMELQGGFPKLDLTEFEVPGRAPANNEDQGLVRLCLGTPDLDTEYQRLVAAGVSFLTAPGTSDHHMADIAVCKDPDGTLIELIQVHLQNWPKS